MNHLAAKLRASELAVGGEGADHPAEGVVCALRQHAQGLIPAVPELIGAELEQRQRRGPVARGVGLRLCHHRQGG